MPFRKNSFFNTTILTVSFIFLAIAINIISITGWLFNNNLLLSWQQNWPATVIYTSIATLIAGIAVLLFTHNKLKPLAQLLSAIVILIGLFQFGQFIVSWNKQFDTLFFIINNNNPKSNIIYNVTPSGALALIFTGTTLLGFYNHPSKRHLFFSVSNFISFSIAFISLVDYLFNNADIHGLVTMSLSTALSIIFLSAGIGFSKPDTGILTVFNLPNKVAVTGFKTALVSIFSVLIISFLIHQGFVSKKLNTQLGTVFLLLIASFFILYNYYKSVVVASLSQKEFLLKDIESTAVFANGILATLTKQIAVMDENGMLVYTNQSWNDFSNKTKNQEATFDRIPVGYNLMKDLLKKATAGNNYALQTINGINAILNNDTELYELRYTCFAGGAKSWNHLKVGKLKSNSTVLVISHNDITEMMNAKIVAEKNEHYLKQIMENSAEMIWSMDKDHRLIFFNEAFSEEFYQHSGSKPQKGIIPYSFMGKDVFEFLKQKVELALSGQAVSFEVLYSIQQQDKYSEIFLYPIKNDYETEGVTCFALNITERKKTAKKLAASENYLRTIYNADPECIKTLGPKGELIDMNPAGLAMLEVDNIEMVLGKSVLEIINEPYRSAFGTLIKNVFKGISGTLEFEIMGFKGTHRWLETSAVPLIDSTGKITSLLSITRDISKQKFAEKKLRANEKKLSELTAALPGVVFQIKIETNGNISFKFISDGIANYFEESVEEFYNDSTLLFSKVHKDDLGNLMDGIKASNESFKPLSSTYRVLAKDLKYRWLRSETAPILLSDGSILRNGSIIDITDSKEAEEKLKESELKYRNLVESNLAGIYQTTLQGDIITCNNAFATILGYASSKDLLNSNANSFYFSETDRNQFINNLIKEKNITNQDIVLKCKDGNPVYLMEHCSLRFDTTLQLEIIDGVIIDITKRKIAEAQLQLSEDKYRNFFEQSADAIFIFDQEGHFMDVNNVAVKLLEYMKEELLQLSVFDLTFKEDLEFNPIHLEQLNQNESVIRERTFKSKSGKKINVEIHSRKLPDGMNMGIVRDITERIKAQEAIFKTNERFERIADTTHDGIWEWNLETNEFWANEMHQQMYGLTKNDPVPSAETWKQNIHPDDRETIVKNFEFARTTGKSSWACEYRFLNSNNEYINIYARNYFIRNNAGKVTSILGSIIDITERKKVELKLEESYESIRNLSKHLQNIREEERTYIAREIHDELGQQLTVMMMDVAWLNKKISPENTIAKNKIAELLNTLNHTINTVRRISTELRPSVLDDMGLKAAVELQLKEFKKRSGILTELIAPLLEPKLSYDVKNALFRIFQESLTNVARHSQSKSLVVEMELNYNSITLKIKDSGIGFDENKVKEKSTLGVLGMKERAESIGGKYNITGELGKGTTIIVNAPMENNN